MCVCGGVPLCMQLYIKFNFTFRPYNFVSASMSRIQDLEIGFDPFFLLNEHNMEDNRDLLCT